MSKIIKDTLVLTIITLVAGLLLGVVYEISKEPIARQQELTKQNSYKSVFDNASEFLQVDIDLEQINKTLADSNMSNTIDEILGAVDENDDKLGYVMKVTSKEGYAGDLTFVIGIQEDGTVTGIEYLSISETAGLGMKAKDSEFKDQFAGKKVEAFTYSKSGALADNEIDAIGGATITTNAVTNGVNAGILIFDKIKEGGSINE